MLKCKKSLATLLAVLTALASLAGPASAAEREGGAAVPLSLFPLEERTLDWANLSSMLPDELGAVPVSLLLGEAGEGLDREARVAWRFLDGGSYETACMGDAIDLSSLWTEAVSQARLEILVPGDPTDPQAVRYIVPVQTSGPKNLLHISALSPSGVEIADSFSWILPDGSALPQFVGSAGTSWKPEDGAALKMEFSSGFQDLSGVEVRVYSGAYGAVEDIPPDADVTEEIWGSGAAGYSADFADEACLFTLTVSRAGQTVLVMPFSLILSPGSPVFISCGDLLDPVSGESVCDRIDSDGQPILKEGAEPGAVYSLQLLAMDFSGSVFPMQPSPACIDAAYAGCYMTKAAAEAAGSQDIAASLFGGGYGADYSRGVTFTIFDIYGCRHVHWFQALAYMAPGEPAGALNGVDRDDFFCVTGVDGEFDAYCAGGGEDSFYAGGWQTVFLLRRDENSAGGAVTAEHIRPVFTVRQGASVYSGHEASGPVQVSGETELPFLPGEPMPYLAVAGQEERRYQVTFVTRRAGGPALFISGVTNGGDRDEAGMFRLSPDMDREGFWDLLIANIGDEAMTGLQASLRGAKNVRLDDYWNFGAASSLAAFTSARPLTVSGGIPHYGALFNMTKIRLVRTGDEPPSGILTVSADGVEPVNILLPGQLELPEITTEALPGGVEGVFYAHQLQAQLPEGWEDVSFTPGSPLPNGLELGPEGEIRGTPKACGNFTITVKLSSGGISCGEKTLVLEIVEDPTPPEDPDIPEKPEDPAPPEDPAVPEKPEDPAPPEDPAIPEKPEDPAPPEDPAIPEKPADPVPPEAPGLPSMPDPPSPPTSRPYVPPAAPEDEGALPPPGDAKGDPSSGMAEIPEEPVPGAPFTPFIDVSPEDWFYEDVCWAYGQELMLGDPDLRFVPEQAVSQATIVTVLARIMDVDLSRYAAEASPSVAPDMWYTQAAIWAQRAGLLPDSQVFTGTAPISRQELAIMLENYLISMGVQPPAGSSVPFEDADQMSEAGRAAFQSLYLRGIFKGVGGLRMDPAGTTTRAQFATLIHRISAFMEDYSLGK